MSIYKPPLNNNPPTPPSDNNLPPPSYTQAPLTPPPDITAAFSNLNLNPTNFPSEDQCLAHLKLLEAISQLREDISARDGLFGIRDDFASINGQIVDDKKIVAIREKRWSVYVAKAVKRFEVWWLGCVEQGGGRLTMENLIERFAAFKQGGEARQVKMLPPLGRSSI